MDINKLIKKAKGHVWINGNDEENVTFKLEDLKEIFALWPSCNKCGSYKGVHFRSSMGYICDSCIYFENGGPYDNAEKKLMDDVK